MGPARPRKTSGQFSARSASSPALQRASSLYGSREPVSARRAWERPVDVPEQHGGAGDLSEPEVVREECHNLRHELAMRRGEERQLSRRVQMLEGSLQLRTQKLDELIKELQGANDGVSNPAELLERLAAAQVDLYSQKEVEGQKRQGELRDRLAEVQVESERLIARLRSDAKDKDSSESRKDDSQSDRPSSANKLRPKLGGGASRGHTPIRSSSNLRRQDEDMVVDHQRSQRELQKQVDQICQQLEEERHSRREKDLTSERLVELLAAQPGQACSASGAGQLPRTRDGTPLGPSISGDVTPPPGPLPPRPCSASISSAAVAPMHRQELEALREEERAQRAAVRRRCRAAAAAAANAAADVVALAGEAEPQVEPEIATSAASVAQPGDALAELRQALQEMNARCQQLEDNASEHARARQAAERKADEAELAASEAQQAQKATAELMQAAEHRAWATTEAANELALQSDLRHVEVLENQLRLQKQLQDAEQRCMVLEAVANQLALRQSS